MKRKATLLLISILFLMSTACDNSLNKAASASRKFALVIGELQKNVYAFYDAKLISVESKDRLIDICKRSNEAGLQVDAILAAIKKADESASEIGLEDREKIVRIITPISEALDPAKLEFIAGIKNPEAKAKLEASLVLARTVLSSIQIITASGG